MILRYIIVIHLDKIGFEVASKLNLDDIQFIMLQYTIASTVISFDW